MLVGLQPVVREIVALQETFPQIVWLGFERQDLADDGGMSEVPSDVGCVLLPRRGGSGIAETLRMILALPSQWRAVTRLCRDADVVHTRGPSVPALLALMYSWLHRRPAWWHKYAGNWGQVGGPRSYRVQRWLLRRARHTHVTINGMWPDQPAHCHSFVNPCLDAAERLRGRQALDLKDFGTPLTACFVGRVEGAKGFAEVLDTVERFPDRIASVLVAGGGPDAARFAADARIRKLPVEFLGTVGRDGLADVYARAHLLLLPSRAEGFPKVIAEAWNSGCVPFVSDVGAVPHYVNNDNGYLWPRSSGVRFSDWFGGLHVGPDELRRRAELGQEFAERFTYNEFVHDVRRMLPGADS